jgi:thermostable 8-oxoguanine DNA glycosylase
MSSLENAVQNVRNEQDLKKTLSKLKQIGQQRWERDDALWFEIVLSLATQGNSEGAQLVVENDRIMKERYKRVSFDTIRQMNNNSRIDQIRQLLLDANVSYQNKTSEALVENFERVEQDYGSPEGLKYEFEQQDGTENKIQFLKKFKLIGPKYARNIGMDLYHPDFRDCIAVDSRIKNIFEAAGFDYEGRSYREREEFLKSIANDLGLEPWELDRILYNYEDAIIEELRTVE